MDYATIKERFNKIDRKEKWQSPKGIISIIIFTFGLKLLFSPAGILFYIAMGYWLFTLLRKGKIWLAIWILTGASFIWYVTAAFTYLAYGYGHDNSPSWYYYLFAVILIGIAIYLFMTIVRNEEVKLEEMEKVLINHFFDPERTVLQLQTQATGGNNFFGKNSIGKVAGGITNGMFGTTGAIVGATTVPLAGKAISGAGKLMSQSLNTAGNIGNTLVTAANDALINTTINTTIKKLKSENVERCISNAEYDEIFRRPFAEIDWKKVALEELELDETQITELPPVSLENYFINSRDETQLVVSGADGVDRTSTYQITWLFGTQKQLCIYQYFFDRITDANQKITEIYFWKDIVNISVTTENIKGNEMKYFLIKTASGEYKCAYRETNETKQTIRGMMSYFRDIKSS